jgi:hypothetical protein
MCSIMAVARAEIIDHRLIYRDPYAYCAHPHMVALGRRDWLLVFNRVVRRAVILHPPQDPEYTNVLMRSGDEGRSWSAPTVVPGYEWHGVECAGLTATSSGRLLLNQWRFQWYPLPAARALAPAVQAVGPRALMEPLAGSRDLDVWAPEPDSVGALFPWARGGGETWVHISDDRGKTFRASQRIDTSPFSGGYGMRGALELPDGELLLPLSDVPNYRVIFAVRSRDGGESWSPPTLVAEEAGREFEEPAGLLLASGRILLMLRENASGILHAVHSDDRGQSWSAPVATEMRDYPAHLLHLGDGRIACVAGRRHPPYGVRIYLSEDGGASWDLEHPVIVRDDLPNKDLGYPTAALRRNGELMVVYYGQDRDGVTGIHATTVRL